MAQEIKKAKEILKSLFEIKEVLSDFRNKIGIKELKAISNVIAGIEYESKITSANLDRVVNYKEHFNELLQEAKKE